MIDIEPVRVLPGARTEGHVMELIYSLSKKPLYLLALGAFAIATEGFMIAPLLPNIAADFAVSVTAAGQLITVFAFAYAISSPILTALTGSLHRRRLLIGSLAAFAIANAIAWAATGFWTLMSARVLLAFAAGLYMPNANAVAGALVPAERRARAIATVHGGASVAIALGVPLGAIVGAAGGWRMTFAGVAVLAAIAAIGLHLGLPRGFGKNLPVASLGQRVRVARQPAVLLALLSTTLWATGAYTVYTYIAVYLEATTGAYGAPLSVVVFIWGVSAVTGMVLGGRFADRIGPHRVLVLVLLVAVVAFAGLSAIARYVPQPHTLLPVLIMVILWGTSIWGFVAPQQARLMSSVGVDVAPVALSLNASFMYIGFSLGASLGTFVLSRGGVAHLGWVGALCELAALGVLVLTRRRAVASAARQPCDEVAPSRRAS